MSFGILHITYFITGMNSLTWMLRGAHHDQQAISGILAFYYWGGGYAIYLSSRVVVGYFF